MKAILCESSSTVRVANLPDPEAGIGEVLIQVGACNLCGSDLHMAEIKDFELPYPFVPGHELAGTVAVAGENVRHVQPGDQVAVQPVIRCGTCPLCRRGHANLCQNPQVIGLHRPGGFAEYVTVPAENVYASDGVPHSTASCTEPLACALYGLRRLNSRVGSDVLIFGAGGMGLFFLQLIRNSGSRRVTVVDLHPLRLQAAEDLGADQVVVADGGEEAMLAEIQPLGFDSVVDATGVPDVVEVAFRHIGPAGRLLMLGSCPTKAVISIRPRIVQSRDITVVGSFGFGFEFPAALHLLREGRVTVDPIVTHRYGLDRFVEAWEQARSGTEAIKVQIVPD